MDTSSLPVADAPATTAIQRLTEWIGHHGPIPTVRMSAARAAGAPANRALESASSDRRSRRLAWDDAVDIASREGRMIVQRIGRLSERDAATVLARLTRGTAP
jgi:hypothetical protein